MRCRNCCHRAATPCRTDGHRIASPKYPWVSDRLARLSPFHGLRSSPHSSRCPIRLRSPAVKSSAPTAPSTRFSCLMPSSKPGVSMAQCRQAKKTTQATLTLAQAFDNGTNEDSIGLPAKGPAGLGFTKRAGRGESAGLVRLEVLKLVLS